MALSKVENHIIYYGKMNYIDKLAKVRSYIQIEAGVYKDEEQSREVRIIAPEEFIAADIEKIITEEKRHLIFLFKTLKNPQRKKLDTYAKYVYFEILVLEEIIHVLRGHKYIPPCFERAPECTYPRNKLPKMLTSDPITKLYGFRLNEIIRVHCHDGRIYYRVIE